MHTLAEDAGYFSTPEGQRNWMRGKVDLAGTSAGPSTHYAGLGAPLKVFEPTQDLVHRGIVGVLDHDGRLCPP